MDALCRAEPRPRRPRAAAAASPLPWARFSAWLDCVCVVTFDLELGQAMESTTDGKNTWEREDTFPS